MLYSGQSASSSPVFVKMLPQNYQIRISVTAVLTMSLPSCSYLTWKAPDKTTVLASSTQILHYSGSFASCSPIPWHPKSHALRRIFVYQTNCMGWIIMLPPFYLSPIQTKSDWQRSVLRYYIGKNSIQIQESLSVHIASAQVSAYCSLGSGEKRVAHCSPVLLPSHTLSNPGHPKLGSPETVKELHGIEEFVLRTWLVSNRNW